MGRWLGTRPAGLALASVLCAACGRLAFDARTDAVPDGPPSPGVVTIAGGPTPGLQDGAGPSARFNNPVNLVVGPDGNLYVADHDNDALRVIAPDGTVSTLLQGHPEVLAPFALLFASDGRLLVGTDFDQIVAIDVASGTVTVRATNVGNVRGFAELPGGRIAFSSFTDHWIKILEVSGAVTPLAGSGVAGFADGNGAGASFARPADLVLLADGSLLVGDSENDRIRRVQLDGTVTTFAGSVEGYQDGNRTAALFEGPGALALASDGTLYVSDRFNDVIRRIDPDGSVTTIAGTRMTGFADATDPLQATFNEVEGIELSPDERFLYLADGSGGLAEPYHRVRRLTL